MFYKISVPVDFACCATFEFSHGGTVDEKKHFLLNASEYHEWEQTDSLE